MKNMCGIDLQMRAGYRAPLGRGNVFMVRYPARWAGLRNHGPLGRNVSANGASSLSPGQRPGFVSPTKTMRPERSPYDRRGRSAAPGEILKVLGQLEAEIQQGMKELEGLIPKDRMEPLLAEAKAITAILTAAGKTAKENRQ